MNNGGTLSHLRPALLAATLAVLCFSPILQSGLTDADAYLRHLSAVAGFDRASASTVYAETAHHYRELQPGWFPLGPVSFAIWLADPPQSSAKLVQLALITLNFGTFAILARRLFASFGTTIFAVVASLSAWQLRMPHDPVIGTSFVMPLLAEWILIAFTTWLVYRSSGEIKWAGISCAAVVCMMLTDPIGWGCAVMLAVMITFDRSREPVRFAWLATVLILAAMTWALGPPRLPWHRHGSFVPAVLAQLIAPLPASYRAFGFLDVGTVASFSHGSTYVDDRFTYVPAVAGWGWLQIIACAVTAFVAVATMLSDAQGRVAPDLQRIGVGVGLIFWLLPSLVLGPASVWYSGVPLGQSFDGVYLQYFGIGILTTTSLLGICRGHAGAKALAPSLAALAAFLLCYGNVRANAASIAKSQRAASSISLIQRAGAAGFFNVLPQGRTVGVSSTEPFATGIHSSVSDAKYALYHFSKQRYRVVPSDLLGDRSPRDSWSLRTSRTSGIFVSLLHVAGYKNGEFLTDRAYGFSAIPSVREALAAPAQGVVLKTSLLQDGFAIQARRTCGPVLGSRVFDGAHPTLSWGTGFYREGPVGYQTQDSGLNGEFFMGPLGTLVIRPTTCAPGPLVLRATVDVAGPATIMSRYLKYTQRIFMTSDAQLIIHVPKTRRPVTVRLATDAPPADFDPIALRYDRDRPRDLRVRFTSAVVGEDASP